MARAVDFKDVDFYESTLNDLPDGLLWTNEEGIIIYSNKISRITLRGTEDKLEGQSIFEVFPAESLRAWMGQLKLRQSATSFLEVMLESGTVVSVYVMMSLSAGENRYSCFLIRENDLPGSDPAEMLRIISEGTAAVVGGDFFRSLAYHVIISTGIRYAIVTECVNIAKTRVRTLVYIERDHFLDYFEYDLTGTPCEIVMRGENYYCTADLDQLFPADPGVKSYFGVPIFLSSGEVIGHIAIFDTKPLRISEQKLNVLKIFASRAGAEIERKRKDEVIQENMARYKSLFDDSPIGLCEEDFSEVRKYVLQLKARYNLGIQEIFDLYPQELELAYAKVKRLNANKSQVQLFHQQSEQQYFDYLSARIQPDGFKELVVAFDRGETVFEKEIEVQVGTSEKKILHLKRILLPGSVGTWSKSLLSCVDMTSQKFAEENLKSALSEVKLLKERLEAENIYLQQEIKLDHNFEEIVSQSTTFKKILEKIELVASTDATVLITGESGTGKELIARAIHSISRRSNRPLVKVNCAALPSTLIESELFGHEKGAFTGAINQKIGRFELSDGGTLFLDEIGEMPLEIQSKLLRVLQEGEFERVGSSKTLRVDVRVIAATNRDLQASVNNKEFRADLYYRLNVFPISSPPLRDRKEDIPVLVNHFCKKHGARMGKKITSVSKGALEVLMAYDWPGNVRELENVIERGLIISQTTILEPGDWLPMLKEQKPSVNRIEKTGSAFNFSGTPQALEDIERLHILEVLQKTNWKIRGEDGAAKILNLNPTTLEARMKKLGITRPK